jgi:hypothetical protein
VASVTDRCRSIRPRCDLLQTLSGVRFDVGRFDASVPQFGLNNLQGFGFHAGTPNRGAVEQIARFCIPHIVSHVFRIETHDSPPAFILTEGNQSGNLPASRVVSSGRRLRPVSV